MEEKNIQAAKSALQNALSLDFQIRQNPVFMIIQAQIEAKNEEWEKARDTLTQAYNLPGVKEAAYGQ